MDLKITKGPKWFKKIKKNRAKKKRPDFELGFLHKTKRVALVYFISKNSNTVVTIIDSLTKKTLDSYSSGAAIAEENHVDPEANRPDYIPPEEPVEAVTDVVAELGLIANKRKLTKKEKRALHVAKIKKIDEEEAKYNKIPRAYRRRVKQSGRLFGHDLRNRLVRYLAKFKKKYGIVLTYTFIVYFKGPSRVRFIILREFLAGKTFIINKFGDLSRTAHNGCRGKKEKRTRAKKKPRKLIGRKRRRRKL